MQYIIFLINNVKCVSNTSSKQIFSTQENFLNKSIKTIGSIIGRKLELLETGLAKTWAL